MKASRFGWRDLYAGTRFLVPLGEEALVEAGRAAGLREGTTLLELACGNGTVAIFLAEEFHAYARGVDASAELVADACRHAERSAAPHRVRFVHEDPARPPDGPFDVVCALREPARGATAALRRGGSLVIGRYLARGGPAERAEIAEAFPLADDPPAGEVRLRREATPLEWERFLSGQERALRKYRRTLSEGDRLSPVALAADRRIATFRGRGAFIAYEVSVVRPETGS